VTSTARTASEDRERHERKCLKTLKAEPAVDPACELIGSEKILAITAVDRQYSPSESSTSDYRSCRCKPGQARAALIGDDVEGAAPTCSDNQSAARKARLELLSSRPICVSKFDGQANRGITRLTAHPLKAAAWNHECLKKA
jgi:hypothetical protein